MQDRMQEPSPRQAWLSAAVLFGKVMAVMLVTHVIVETAVETLSMASLRHGTVLEHAAVAILGGSLMLVVAILPLRKLFDAERHATSARELQMRHDGRRQDFESRLHRAFAMSETEDAANDVVRRAVAVAVPDARSELLLADSSDAHLKRAVEVGPDNVGPRCDVPSPHTCPAIRRGQTLTFNSSEELDSCPQLRGRDYGACSAVCVPLNVAGRSVGVLHTVGPVNSPPQDESVARLEALATHGGARLGMLRVMERTTLQAATDPLTGLLNRRSLENMTSPLQTRGEPFALAIGDLDHFKRLNDTHGHETGDRALRLFARTLRSSVRGEDLVCRFGGEEFVIVFPRCTSDAAASVLRRMQEELLVAIAQGNVPGFTVSYGVTDSSQASTLDELVRIADLHLFQAKREGRNRVVVDGEQDAPIPG